MGTVSDAVAITARAATTATRTPSHLGVGRGCRGGILSVKSEREKEPTGIECGKIIMACSEAERGLIFVGFTYNLNVTMMLGVSRA